VEKCRPIIFLILLGSSLFALYSNRRQPEIIPPSLIEEPKLRWSELSFEYRFVVMSELRANHLVKICHADPELASRIVAAVEEGAELYSLDIDLVLGLILVESHCSPEAVSFMGALGLMQVMPATGKFISHSLGFKWSGDGVLRAIESNIAYGTWYLHYLRTRFPKNEHAVIASYNWGPEHIQGRINRSEPLPQVYPGKVYEATEKLRQYIWSDEYNKIYWQGVDKYIENARREGR